MDSVWHKGYMVLLSTLLSTYIHHIRKLALFYDNCNMWLSDRKNYIMIQMGPEYDSAPSLNTYVAEMITEMGESNSLFIYLWKGVQLFICFFEGVPIWGSMHTSKIKSKLKYASTEFGQQEKRCNEFITKIKATDKINALPIGYLAGT